MEEEEVRSVFSEATFSHKSSVKHVTIPATTLTYDLEVSQEERVNRSHCLQMLLHSGMGSDVTFVVGTECEHIAAHKAILIARSSRQKSSRSSRSWLT